MSKVLYAEDEYTNRKLLKILLQREGIDCDLAADGAGARGQDTQRRKARLLSVSKDRG